MIELPVTIDWGPKPVYDIGRDADRRIVYERVLREAATTEEVARFVNGSVLVAVWPRLFLPARASALGETLF